MATKIMLNNFRALVVLIFVTCRLTCGQQASAGEATGRRDMLCDSIATPATGPFIDVFNARMREAIAHNDWRYIRTLIWDGADPVLLRRTKWFKRAQKEVRNRDLVHAAALGDNQLILRLIRAGADLNVKPDYDENMAPLIWAARCDQASAAGLLLHKGANVNITADFSGSATGVVRGSTPLIWAASYGNVAVVKILIAQRANPNAQETVIDNIDAPTKGRKGNTPLVESANEETTELLLRAKADPNLTGVNSISPLMMAASRGSIEQCKLLLAWGADARLKDRFGQTAVDWAEQAGHLQLAELLAHSP